MANSNGWGDGSVNNNIGWGQGSNNAVGWGKSHLDSWAGATDIDGGNLPSNSVAPAITGTAQEGQTLTCSTGTWSGSPTYAYQWKRNGSNIGSATNSTYTLVTADVGQSIKCTVTATNFVGSATADSNTVVPVSAFNFLLDTYSSAAAAYSLRKLRSAYTGNAIRVRRSSDNTEQDFGFVNNVLDTASLLTFCGAGDGFVTTWYDQSGNTKDVTETTAANQPQIVTSGSVELLNGKPMIKFNGTSHKLTAASSIISGQFGVYGVAQTPATQTGFMFTQYRTFSANRFILYLEYGTSNLMAVQIGGSADVKTGTRTNAQKLYYWNRNASNLIQYADNNSSPNSVTITTTAANETLMFGGFQDIAFNYRTQNLQECVIYTSDSSSNRTGISSNINSFYTIY